MKQSAIILKLFDLNIQVGEIVFRMRENGTELFRDISVLWKVLQGQSDFNVDQKCSFFGRVPPPFLRRVGLSALSFVLSRSVGTSQKDTASIPHANRYPRINIKLQSIIFGLSKSIKISETWQICSQTVMVFALKTLF